MLQIYRKWKWVRSRNCSCLVTWFCYQLITGNKTATVLWPDPNIFYVSWNEFSSMVEVLQWLLFCLQKKHFVHYEKMLSKCVPKEGEPIRDHFMHVYMVRELGPKISFNMFSKNNKQVLVNSVAIFDSLPHGRFLPSSSKVVVKFILAIDGWNITHEVSSRWMALDLTDDKSTLAQVMAWCRQATSHYLSQCWSRSLSPYGVTRPQWFKKKKEHSNGWHVVKKIWEEQLGNIFKFSYILIDI